MTWRFFPPGEFDAFVAETLAMAKRPKVTAFGRVSWDDLDQKGAETEYIVDDWLTRGDKSVLGGASGSGKSFLAIDMGISIALGRSWLGQQTKPGLVIYQAGEGGRGVKGRLRAFRKQFGITAKKVPFELLTSRIDIYAADDGGGDTKKLIDAIKGIQSEYPDIPLLSVFIDTLATAQGAADEISGKDMAVVLNNIDRIARETGAHVCLVHHMNAEGKKLRGHTSLRANVDQVLIVTRNEQTNVRTVVLDKIKDGEDGKRLQFELMSVDIGEREDGKRITSCVCLPVGEKEAIRKEEEQRGVKLNPFEVNLMKALFEADTRYGQPVPVEAQLDAKVRSIVDWGHVTATYAGMNPLDEDTTGMTDEQIAKAKEGHKSKHTMRVKRAREYLTNQGVVGFWDKNAYWTGKPLRAFPHTQPPKPRAQPKSTEVDAELQGTGDDFVF